MFISESLSQFCASLTHDGIPDAVRTRVKHLLLDAIGIAFASGKYDFAQCALRGLGGIGEGNSEVIGFRETLSLRDAALVNGILVHGLDYDDTYLPGSMHVTASNVPAAIGVASHVDANGRDLLVALVAGLEIGARVAGAGKGGFQKAGFFATGVCAAFSCALVAGRLMKLSADELTMAQGIALATASGSMQPLRDGSWTKRMHPGWAACAGITAASMARGGFIGPKESYEGHYGLFTTYLGAAAGEAEPAMVTRHLGSVWEVQRASFKLFPAGHLSHAFMTATLALVAEHHIVPDEVEAVTALVGANAIPIICEPVENKCRPTTSYMAQFGLQYGIACCLKRRAFGLAEIEPEIFNDPALHALARKVRYEVDPDSGFPKFRSGEVIIRLKDGRQVRRREVIQPDEPATDAEVQAKFMQNACMVMDKARAESILASVLSIESEPSARRFSRSLAA